MEQLEDFDRAVEAAGAGPGDGGLRAARAAAAVFPIVRRGSVALATRYSSVA